MELSGLEEVLQPKSNTPGKERDGGGRGTGKHDIVDAHCGLVYAASLWSVYSFPLGIIIVAPALILGPSISKAGYSAHTRSKALIPAQQGKQKNTCAWR